MADVLIGNLGRRRMGKTTLAVHMAEKVARRVILDPRRSIRRKGAIVCYTAARLPQAMEALAEGATDEVVYSPTESDLPAAFAAFASELRAWMTTYPRKSLAAIVDESSFYGSIASNADFMFAVKCSDPTKLHIILTCHRPSDVDTDVRALLNRWCIFRTTQEHDLDVLRRRCKSDVVELVQSLGDCEFVAWNDDDGTYTVNRTPYLWQTDLVEPGAKRSILELH